MLANWVRELTATTGTGTISLGGAPAGFVPFSAQFATADVCYYSIEDGNNREIGIGTLASGTPWTLTRTTVLETLVGGTLTKSGATAISLSGSAVVMVAAGVSSSYPVVGGRAGARVIFDAYSSKNGTNVQLTANELLLMPFTLLFSAVVNAVRLWQIVTASSTGAVGRVGIYASKQDGTPGRLIAEGISALNMAATGYQVGASVPVNKLQRGHYYLGLLTDGNAVVSGLESNGYFNPFMQGCAAGGAASHLNFKQLVDAGWSAMPTDVSGAIASEDYAKQPRLQMTSSGV